MEYMSDDQRNIYLESAHDDTGICCECGHWYPPSEYEGDPRTCRECLEKGAGEEDGDA